MMNVRISADQSQLDLTFIHQFLTRSYWAQGRTPEQVKVTLENSICYGVYKESQQIGFARVVTDKAVFAYVMDVFITEDERGKGYASMLMDYILSDPQLKEVSRWMLGTRDAHALYRKFGFSELPNPDWQMGLTRKT